MRVGALPAFKSRDLDEIQRAFERAAACELRQAWKVGPDERFAPGTVRVGWREDDLLAYAGLSDADIFSRASGLNQRLWELGDAFEIFLQPAGEGRYVELQVSPNNHRLQLGYTNRDALDRARRTGDLSGALIEGDAFRSQTWIDEAHARWHVLVEIPARMVSGPGEALSGARWRFSFGRYDYTRDCFGPVISSTSPHAEPDFHRQQEWGVLEFER